MTNNQDSIRFDTIADVRRLTCVGGWWSLPTNWRRNTLLLGLAGAGTVIIIWQYTGKREVRHSPPLRRIPSMMVKTSLDPLLMTVESSCSRGIRKRSTIRPPSTTIRPRIHKRRGDQFYTLVMHTQLERIDDVNVD
jgi:hypothetical protein